MNSHTSAIINQIMVNGQWSAVAKINVGTDENIISPSRVA